MMHVNILEAKTNFSKLVDAVERGIEREIIIARNGRPAARLVPIAPVYGQRIGVAKGEFVAPVPDAAFDAEVARLMTGDDPARAG